MGKHAMAFLSKKSWHPANQPNQEKVWLAEQADQAEKRKIEAWQKEREEERRIMELQQLQQSSGQTGGKTPAAKERVDFLYEVPMAKKEEYLLGKPVEAKPDESDVKKVEQLPGSTFLIGQNNLSSMANEEFNKMTNDPLMAMRAEEQKALQRLMANPVKMKQIRGAVEERQASLMADGASSSRSGERHSHHHRHHHHKKHKHERHSSKHDKHDKHERRHDKHERKHERKRRREERKQSSNRGGRPGAGSASSASSSDEEADGGSGGGGVGRHQAPPRLGVAPGRRRAR